MKTFKDFFKKHHISRSAIYGLWAKGIGPDVLRVGGRIWITDEAETRWIAANEAPWSPSNVGGPRPNAGRFPKAKAAAA